MVKVIMQSNVIIAHDDQGYFRFRTKRNIHVAQNISYRGLSLTQILDPALKYV